MPKFEECLDRLEKIVSEMEKGDIPLERALALFEEGVKLSNSCRGELETAEGKVEILLKQMQATDMGTEVPDLARSLEAVRVLKLARERPLR